MALHYYIIRLDDLLNTSATKIAGSHGNITSPKGFWYVQRITKLIF